MHDSFEILVVEDNPVEFRLMQEAFEGPGIPNRLHRTADGEEALAFLRKAEGFHDAARPDLILLDLNMPRKGGLAVLAEIKADPGLRSIPTVILTSSNAQADVDRAFDLQANGYVRKPVDLDDFMAVMGTVENFWAGVSMRPSRAAA